MVDRTKLSAEAQKLIELTGQKSRGDWGRPGDVDLAAILQQYPELIKGVNEYMKWRDDEMVRVEKQQTTQPVGHGITEALKGLSKLGK